MTDSTINLDIIDSASTCNVLGPLCWIYKRLSPLFIDDIMIETLLVDFSRELFPQVRRDAI